MCSCRAVERCSRDSCLSKRYESRERLAHVVVVKGSRAINLPTRRSPHDVTIMTNQTSVTTTSISLIKRSRKLAWQVQAALRVLANFFPTTRTTISAIHNKTRFATTEHGVRSNEILRGRSVLHDLSSHPSYVYASYSNEHTSVVNLPPCHEQDEINMAAPVSSWHGIKIKPHMENVRVQFVVSPASKSLESYEAAAQSA